MDAGERVAMNGLYGSNGSDHQLWQGMLTHLRASHPGLCRQWFHEIEPVDVDAGVLRLRTRTTIHRDYLRRQCLEAFNDAARTVSQRLLTIQFFGPDDQIPASTAAAAPATQSRSQTAAAHSAAGAAPAAPMAHAGSGGLSLAGTQDGAAPSGVIEPKPVPAGPIRWPLTTGDERRPMTLVINPDYAFEHFVVGPNNRFAHAAACAVAANPGRAYNPYFVHGGVGLGKTHLLQAICLRIKENAPGARIFYTSCEGFMTQFMEAVQAGEMAAFRNRFRDVDVLVIDDVHFLAKRDRTQEEFFHTFNSLYQDHKQIVMSSDAPPEEIPDLEDRLVSRFKWGLVTSVAAPQYETRVEIVKNKAKMRGFELPDEIACFIAEKIDSNIRELEGAVIKIQVALAVEKRPLDVAMAASLLGEGRAVERRLHMTTIVDAVTEFFGVKVTDLQSKRRQRSIALPRQVCMYFARRHTRHSLEEIGGFFGGRDHTTVMHAVKTVEDRCQTDPDFQRVIQTLDGRLRQSV